MKKQGRTDWGIGPNIEVKLRRDEIIKIDELQWDNLVLARADHDSNSTPLKKHTAEEILASDPQLAIGILVIRSKLIEESGKVKTKNAKRQYIPHQLEAA